jgi:hypothetical protein
LPPSGKIFAQSQVEPAGGDALQSFFTSHALVLLALDQRYYSDSSQTASARVGGGRGAGDLSDFASEKDVGAATQNQVLCALLFLYRELLAMELGAIGSIARVTRHRKLPTGLKKEEVKRVLAAVGPE